VLQGEVFNRISSEFVAVNHLSQLQWFDRKIVSAATDFELNTGNKYFGNFVPASITYSNGGYNMIDAKWITK